jgi:hypothetical protein
MENMKKRRRNHHLRTRMNYLKLKTKGWETLTKGSEEQIETTGN